MKREWEDYLADIIQSMNEVEEFTRGLTYESFMKDRKTINAVIRSLEVMGEASKRIPDEVRAKHSEIPWKRMAGMRDKLIHEYAGVDLETVWDAIQEEIPPIRPLLEELQDNP
jgi:uncharacterized protein with HEPN domain